MRALDIEDLRELLRLTPRRKAQNRTQMSPPGVGIVDIGSKVLDEALGSLRRRRIERRNRPVNTWSYSPAEFLALTHILRSALPPL